MKPRSTAIDTLGVVLAGGQSQRMGRDKAALRLEGVSFLARAKSTLLAAGCFCVACSSKAGSVDHVGNERLDSERLHLDARIIPDQLPAAGPVGGVISVLDSMVNDAPDLLNDSALENRQSALLFVPVDTPLLLPELLQEMRQMLDGAQSDDFDGVVIKGYPLPLLLRPNQKVRSRCDEARRGVQKGESWSVKRLIAPLNLAVLALTPAIKAQLRNINTLDDWKELQHEFKNQA